MGKNRTLWLLLAVVVLAVVPLLMGGEFGGADGAAAELIEAENPGFVPWANPLWEPPSGEIESLLFALQAAIGAFVIGYVVGRRHERAKTTQKPEGRAVSDAA
ncbi:cobalt/nickel transport protein [Rhodobacter sp. JA431]|uniref:energy-coupling factor ABC transporter substrate-binding protein n=1 Tax=Rhodobacter sp. JA431 TaxID=570013 RepID=UPI000BD1A837|nr:energy-coupling factor ABC transporter substrate-binding protein [Rhodobacter sp. JA431]SOB99133.1 cobalt/nickel transport protein [Rhodobacter sp. JA431]